MSKAGTALAKASTAKFTVEPKPKPKPKAKPPRPRRRRRSSKPKPIPKSGGGGAVAGGWAGVESYYLRPDELHADRRLGHLDGQVQQPGGRNVAPLALEHRDQHQGLPSVRQAARRRATICSHFIGGNPGDRLRRAGYDSYRWAENLGCRSGNPSSAVLGSHLFFQSEKSYNGGHYVNMMNAKLRPRRDRRLGVRRPGPPGGRLLPPLTWTHPPDGTFGG